MRSVAEAQSQILARVKPGLAEEVPLEQACFRVLAEDARAELPLPAVDNSAMDGFAVCAADLPGTLPVVATVRAGDPPGAELQPGTAIRIMTGAPLPRGADTVVIQEETSMTEDSVVIAAPGRVGDNIRKAGEDVGAGNRVLVAGADLDAGEIGMLAALGQARVKVARRPVVAVLATGDELVPPGQPLPPGKLYSSSSYSLAGQILEAGGVPLLLGVAADDRATITERIRSGLNSDVLLTTGGVSVGEYDLVRESLGDAGVTLDFWKVAMKPGKPLAFGRSRAGTLVFGLPGNPVSTMVGFELFVRPALRALQGARRVHRSRVKVSIDSDYEKARGRAHYLRAILDLEQTPPQASLLTRQGSATLSSMVGVDALIEIPAEFTRVSAGERTSALLLRWR